MYNKLIVKKIIDQSYLLHRLILNRFIESARVVAPIELVGFFDAETFDDSVTFFKGNFYLESVAEIFEDVVESKNDISKFSEDEIVFSKKQIEVEESGKVHNFLFKIMAPSEIESKVALRLHPFVHDFVADILRQNLAVIKDSTALLGRDGDLVFGFEVLAGESFDFEKVQSEIIEKIRNYPVRQNWNFIKNFFKVFVKDDIFMSMPVEFYRNTGILTSRDEVLALLSIETIEKVIEKINTLG